MLTTNYSPHREGGGMMQLHSPSHSPLLDSPSASAIREIRRTLAKSPSKTPFHLRATHASSPLSPSRKSTSDNVLYFQAQTPPAYATRSAQPNRLQRPQLKRTAQTVAPVRTRTSPKSPCRRVLSDSTDTNMRSPIIRKRRSTELDDDDTDMCLDDANKENTYNAMQEDDVYTPWKSSQARPDRRKVANLHLDLGPLSPLKRPEHPTSSDQAALESPSVKRRTMHAPSSLDFSIFDSDSLQDDTKRSQDDHDWFRSIPASAASASSKFSTIPKRSSSLRKSTLQQRQHQGPSPLRSHFLQNWIDQTPDAKKPFRMSLNMPPPPRDSPFSAQGNLISASIHPIMGPPAPAPDSTSQQQQKHPLSFAQSHSSTEAAMAAKANQHCTFDFSKSLPTGALRPQEYDNEQPTQTDSQPSWATPATFKSVKPLPAAFMSTGLISKKNRNVDMPEDAGLSKAPMPDTPCKKQSLMFDPKDQSKPATSTIVNLRASLQQQPKSPCDSPFGINRTTPFPWAKTSGLFANKMRQSLARTTSFASLASIDADEKPSSQPASIVFDSQSTDTDAPDTPTKHHVEHEQRAVSISPSPQHFLPESQVLTSSSQPISFISGEWIPKANPFALQLESSTMPQTPIEHVFPPDPSTLSISGRMDRPTTRHSNDHFSPFVPATPTGPREYFANFSNRPSLNLNAPDIADVDQTLSARFDKIDLIGTGEFSSVYRVTQRSQASPFAKGLTGSRSSSRNSAPVQVWAVKKSRHAYTGPKDRARKVHEVDVLKTLGQSEHIVYFVDSWEDKGHLYIQTEFCEEGTLDIFLANAGMKARLDDFRIWKILLELSLGLKHIHDTGFIHLDIKPANVLVTFEGVLKIADFGMTTKWPARSGIEGEGDREYIGPEILMGKYDKPADIFALGLIMFETAGNVELPDNGQSWQKLRNGDTSDVPSLTWSSADSSILRDAQGNPLDEDECVAGADIGVVPPSNKLAPGVRRGELAEPPEFMVDNNSEQAIDRLVQWMIRPDPQARPVIDELLTAHGVQWVQGRRRAGATIFEGVWGPADDVLAEDAEMLDV